MYGPVSPLRYMTLRVVFNEVNTTFLYLYQTYITHLMPGLWRCPQPYNFVRVPGAN